MTRMNQVSRLDEPRRYDAFSMVDSKLISEASRAWKRFGDVLQATSLSSESFTVNDVSQHEFDSRSVVHRLPQGSIEILEFGDRSRWIFGLNKAYGFWLESVEGCSGFKIVDVLPTNVLPETHIIHRSFKRSYFPDFVLCDSLLELIQRPSFKVLSLSNSPTKQHPGLYRLVFEDSHVSGELFLDSHNNWLIQESRLEQAEPQQKQHVHRFRFEFDVEFVDGIRLPTLRKWCDGRDWNKLSSDVTHFQLLENSKYSQMNIELTDFGFPEPNFDSLDNPVRVTADSGGGSQASGAWKVPFTLCNTGEQDTVLVRVGSC